MENHEKSPSIDHFYKINNFFTKRIENQFFYLFLIMFCNILLIFDGFAILARTTSSLSGPKRCIFSTQRGFPIPLSSFLPNQGTLISTSVCFSVNGASKSPRRKICGTFVTMTIRFVIRTVFGLLMVSAFWLHRRCPPCNVHASENSRLPHSNACVIPWYCSWAIASASNGTNPSNLQCIYNVQWCIFLSSHCIPMTPNVHEIQIDICKSIDAEKLNKLSSPKNLQSSQPLCNQ